PSGLDQSYGALSQRNKCNRCWPGPLERHDPHGDPLPRSNSDHRQRPGPLAWHEPTSLIARERNPSDRGRYCQIARQVQDAARLFQGKLKLEAPFVRGCTQTDTASHEAQLLYDRPLSKSMSISRRKARSIAAATWPASSPWMQI